MCSTQVVCGVAMVARVPVTVAWIPALTMYMSIDWEALLLNRTTFTEDIDKVMCS